MFLIAAFWFDIPVDQVSFYSSCGNRLRLLFLISDCEYVQESGKSRQSSTRESKQAPVPEEAAI